MKVSILLQIWHQRMTSHALYDYIVWTRKLHNKPSQVRPSAPNWYPLSHWHVYDPGRFKQICWQPCSPVAHSSLSVSNASKTPLKAWQQWTIDCHKHRHTYQHKSHHLKLRFALLDTGRQPSQTSLYIREHISCTLLGLKRRINVYNKCILYIVTFHVIKNWPVTY